MLIMDIDTYVLRKIRFSTETHYLTQFLSEAHFANTITTTLKILQLQLIEH